jgi:hypothetical protein
MRWHDLDTHALREQYSFGLSSQRVKEQAARNKGQFTSANAVQDEETQQLFGVNTLNGSKSSPWVDKIGDQGAQCILQRYYKATLDSDLIDQTGDVQAKLMHQVMTLTLRILRISMSVRDARTTTR